MAGLYQPGDEVSFMMTLAGTSDGRTGQTAATSLSQTGKVLAEETPGKYRVTTDFGIAILVDEGQLAAAAQAQS